MARKIFGITNIYLSSLFLTFIFQARSLTIDITTLGAKPDGSDISMALLTAWGQACHSTTPTTIVIPAGTFVLKEAHVNGPCLAPIRLHVEGTVQAPNDPNAITKDKEWFMVEYVNEFTLSGRGVFDGQGARAWTQNDCQKADLCNRLANSFAFNFVNNSIIKDITSKNSKLFHFNIFGSENVTFSKVTIDAPGNSPNTDGIHIGHCNGITIVDTKIATGDDCISIGDGSTRINIKRVTCGPGHGISVGSLGRYPNEQPVEGIFVKNCTIFDTTNGVRIKTWPARESGVASDMHFENIMMRNVSNPVIIDQIYCPNNQCQLHSPSKVKLKKISFKGIKGTSATANVMSLVCSSSHPCEGVEIGDIHLQYTGTEGLVTTNCTNVKPTLMGSQFPPVCGPPLPHVSTTASIS